MKGDHHVILRVVAKALIPVIALYGFYVQFHGDFGPGGGFQASPGAAGSPGSGLPRFTAE